MSEDDSRGSDESDATAPSDGFDRRPRDAAAIDRLDETFELLGDGRRRALLYSLVGTEEETASLAWLIDEVMAREPGNNPDAPGERIHVGTSLHHLHLPMLADAGVVEYDDSGHVCRYRGDDLLESYLRRAYEDERP